MKLKFAIICDNAFTDSDGRLSIIQAFNIISTDNFPTVYPKLTIVTHYELEEGDNPTIPYNQVLVIKQGQTEIFRGEKSLTLQAGRSGSLQFIANIVGLTFPQSGECEISTTLNQENFGKVTTLKVKNNSN